MVAFIDMLQFNFAHSSPILVYRYIYAILSQIQFFAVLCIIFSQTVFMYKKKLSFSCLVRSFPIYFELQNKEEICVPVFVKGILYQ